MNRPRCTRSRCARPPGWPRGRRGRPGGRRQPVFVKEHNVWLANPDGSGQYQVTFDGTAGAPYESPSQANDGTIVAIRETPGQRRQLYRMSQSGQALEPPDQHAGARHRRDQREGLAQRRAGRVLVPHHGQRPALRVLRERLEPGAAQPLEPLHQPHRSRHAQHRRLAILGLERHDRGRERQRDAVVLQARNAGGGRVVRGSDFVTRELPDAARRRSRPDRRPARGGARQPPGDDPAAQDGRAAPGQTDRREPAVRPAHPTHGKFIDPTWSSDGRLLAWQEDDGVWSGASRQTWRAAPAWARSHCAFRRHRARPQPRADQPRSPSAVRQPRQPDLVRRAHPRRATRAPGPTRRSTPRPSAARSTASRRTSRAGWHV